MKATTVHKDGKTTFVITRQASGEDVTKEAILKIMGSRFTYEDEEKKK